MVLNNLEVLSPVFCIWKCSCGDSQVSEQGKDKNSQRLEPAF